MQFTKEPFLPDNQSQFDPMKKFCSDCQTKQQPLLNMFYDDWICLKCYADQNQKQKMYPQIDEILQNLYLGNQDAAMDQGTLQKYQIGAIMACGSYLMKPYKNKYPYKQYDIADHPQQKIYHLFDDSYQWIINQHKQNKKVLVHCAAGVSRSASFTIAFIMKFKGMGFQQAKNYVKQRRKWINPNTGFRKQLEQYEQILKESKVN